MKNPAGFFAVATSFQQTFLTCTNQAFILFTYYITSKSKQ